MSTQDQKPPIKGAPNPAANPANLTNSTTTVTVCCKMPNGFLMELGNRDDPDYRCYGLKGISHMRVAGAEWGITTGIPKDFWEVWRESKKQFKMIKGGFIFAQANQADAKAQAKEMEGLKTGLERLTPKNLPKSMKDVEKKVTELVED